MDTLEEHCIEIPEQTQERVEHPPSPSPPPSPLMSDFISFSQPRNYYSPRYYASRQMTRWLRSIPRDFILSIQNQRLRLRNMAIRLFCNSGIKKLTTILYSCRLLIAIAVLLWWLYSTGRLPFKDGRILQIWPGVDPFSLNNNTVLDLNGSSVFEAAALPNPSILPNMQ